MNSIFRIQGTLSFLSVIFLNAFVDLGHKITIQNTIFKVYDGGEQIVLTAIVNGLILLPFILLFSPSGFISDKYPKTSVMKVSALVAVFITILITISYLLGWFWLAFALTFVLAMQSAFYGPAKLAYIKVLYGDKNLTPANGLTQATAMVAILLGTFIFSIFFEYCYAKLPLDIDITETVILQNLWWVGLLLVACSVLEWLLTYRLPVQEVNNQQVHFNFSDYLSGKLIYNNIQQIVNAKIVLWSILGLCIFWTAGQVMLAAFPAFVKEQVGLTNTIVLQLILASTGIGIIVGAILAGRLSRGFINTKLIVIGAAGLILGLALLPFLKNTTLMAIDFACIGIAGGLFVVPLNALVQYHADQSKLGSTLAGKNFFQNIFMLSFLVLTALFAYKGLSSQQLLLLLAVFVLVFCIYVVIRLQKALNIVNKQ